MRCFSRILDGKPSWGAPFLADLFVFPRDIPGSFPGPFPSWIFGHLPGHWLLDISGGPYLKFCDWFLDLTLFSGSVRTPPMLNGNGLGMCTSPLGLTLEQVSLGPPESPWHRAMFLRVHQSSFDDIPWSAPLRLYAILLPRKNISPLLESIIILIIQTLFEVFHQVIILLVINFQISWVLHDPQHPSLARLFCQVHGEAEILK